MTIVPAMRITTTGRPDLLSRMSHPSPLNG
jgi:hypothetical protein